MPEVIRGASEIRRDRPMKSLRGCPEEGRPHIMNTQAPAGCRADITRQAMTIKQAQKQVKQALRDHERATSEGRRLKAAYDHILASTFLEGVDHGVRLERKRRR